ncbi:MAG: hypothetical protein ABIH71_07255, partial [Candidatus Omnitrophota bacterium]
MQAVKQGLNSQYGMFIVSCEKKTSQLPEQVTLIPVTTADPVEAIINHLEQVSSDIENTPVALVILDQPGDEKKCIEEELLRKLPSQFKKALVIPSEHKAKEYDLKAGDYKGKSVEDPTTYMINHQGQGGVIEIFMQGACASVDTISPHMYWIMVGTKPDPDKNKGVPIELAKQGAERRRVECLEIKGTLYRKWSKVSKVNFIVLGCSQEDVEQGNTFKSTFESQAGKRQTQVDERVAAMAEQRNVSQLYYELIGNWIYVSAQDPEGTAAVELGKHIVGERRKSDYIEELGPQEALRTDDSTNRELRNMYIRLYKDAGPGSEFFNKAPVNVKAMILHDLGITKDNADDYLTNLNGLEVRRQQDKGDVNPYRDISEVSIQGTLDGINNSTAQEGYVSAFVTGKTPALTAVIGEMSIEGNVDKGPARTVIEEIAHLFGLDLNDTAQLIQAQQLARQVIDNAFGAMCLPKGLTLVEKAAVLARLDLSDAAQRAEAEEFANDMADDVEQEWKIITASTAVFAHNNAFAKLMTQLSTAKQKGKQAVRYGINAIDGAEDLRGHDYFNMAPDRKNPHYVQACLDLAIKLAQRGLVSLTHYEQQGLDALSQLNIIGINVEANDSRKMTMSEYNHYQATHDADLLAILRLSLKLSINDAQIRLLIDVLPMLEHARRTFEYNNIFVQFSDQEAREKHEKEWQKAHCMGMDALEDYAFASRLYRYYQLEDETSIKSEIERKTKSLDEEIAVLQNKIKALTEDNNTEIINIIIVQLKRLNELREQIKIMVQNKKKIIKQKEQREKEAQRTPDIKNPVELAYEKKFKREIERINELIAVLNNSIKVLWMKVEVTDSGQTKLLGMSLKEINAEFGAWVQFVQDLMQLQDQGQKAKQGIGKNGKNNGTRGINKKIRRKEGEVAIAEQALFDKVAEIRNDQIEYLTYKQQKLEEKKNRIRQQVEEKYAFAIPLRFLGAFITVRLRDEKKIRKNYHAIKSNTSYFDPAFAQSRMQVGNILTGEYFETFVENVDLTESNSRLAELSSWVGENLSQMRVSLARGAKVSFGLAAPVSLSNKRSKEVTKLIQLIGERKNGGLLRTDEVRQIIFKGESLAEVVNPTKKEEAYNQLEAKLLIDAYQGKYTNRAFEQRLLIIEESAGLAGRTKVVIKTIRKYLEKFSDPTSRVFQEATAEHAGITLKEIEAAHKASSSSPVTAVSSSKALGSGMTDMVLTYIENDIVQKFGKSADLYLDILYKILGIDTNTDTFARNRRRHRVVGHFTTNANKNTEKPTRDLHIWAIESKRYVRKHRDQYDLCTPVVLEAIRLFARAILGKDLRVETNKSINDKKDLTDEEKDLVNEIIKFVFSKAENIDKDEDDKTSDPWEDKLTAYLEKMDKETDREKAERLLRPVIGVKRHVLGSFLAAYKAPEELEREYIIRAQDVSYINLMMADKPGLLVALLVKGAGV